MNLKARLKALEAAAPDKPLMTFEIMDEPTAQQQLEIMAAHDAGHLVFIFKSNDDTLGVLLPGSNAVHWGADNG